MRNLFHGLILATFSLCIAAPLFAADPKSAPEPTAPPGAVVQPQTPGLAPNADLKGRKKIVFLSGHPSHGYAQHEHFAGCMLLAKALNENVPQVYAEVYKYEWPADPHAFDDAAAIIMYCDGGAGHMAMKHLKEIDALMDKGIGLGCIHYAVEDSQGRAGR